MTTKKEKGATSASTELALPELASVRFIEAIDIASEAHHFFSTSTRVRSKNPKAYLDRANNLIEIKVELSGVMHVSYVPMSNVASYSRV